MPELGSQLAAGGTSTIHAWGAGAVLKLFTPAYRYAVELEAERARTVHAAGVPSPAVLDVVEVDGRRGIVFERIDGPLLFVRLASDGDEPVARELARLHRALHAFEAPGLPRIAALGGRDDLGPEVVCHGDFHPGNVILAERGEVAIDWVNAHAAPAALDVARSGVLMAYQGLDARTPPALRARRARIALLYLDAYLEGSGVTRAQLLDAAVFAARALLRAQPGNAARDELALLAASGR